MAKRDKAKLKRVLVSLPFGLGEIEWEADPTERRAAWALYVELVTRIAVQPLGADHGVLREALSSLHSLFGATRAILKEAGPGVGAAPDTVGGLAIALLNRGLRPLLDKWHPLLSAWEVQRPERTAPSEHEQAFPKEVRGELEVLRNDLEQYARALAAIAGVEP